MFVFTLGLLSKPRNPESQTCRACGVCQEIPARNNSINAVATRNVTMQFTEVTGNSSAEKAVARNEKRLGTHFSLLKVVFWALCLVFRGCSVRSRQKSS